MARPRKEPVYETGPVRVTGSGRSWRIRWMELGVERERTTTSRTAAVELADEAAERLALATGATVSGAAAFGALADAWMDRHENQWSAGHLANVRAILNGHVAPKLGAVSCDRITDDHLDALVRSMSAAGYSADWCANATRTLRALCRWGVSRGVWAPHRNPAANLKAPAATTLAVDRQLIPTSAQVRAMRTAIAAAAPNDAQARRREWIVAAAAGCGLRWGEILAVTPAEVDLARRRVQVVRSWHEHGGQHLGAPKSRHSQRTVVIPSDDVELWQEVLDMTTTGEFLSQTEKNKVWRNPNWHRIVWHPAMAKVTDWPEGARFHALRHHAIVRWLEAGVPIGDASALAGHHSAAFTMARYVGPASDHLDRAAGLL